MKKTIAMILAAAFAAHTANAVNWTNAFGGALDVEANWNKPFASWAVNGDGVFTETADFRFDRDVTLTAYTGWTNGAVTFYATNCTVTLDVAPGKEYFVSPVNNYSSLYAVNPPAMDPSFAFTGGGTFRCQHFYLQGPGNRTHISGNGTTLEFLTGGILSVGSNRDNTLAVSGGAKVLAAGNIEIGSSVNSSNNVALFTGQGTFLQSRRDDAQRAMIIVGGENAVNNQFILEDRVVCSNCTAELHISRMAGGSANAMTVRSGALYSNLVPVTVGQGLGNAGTAIVYDNSLAVSNQNSRFYCNTLEIGQANGVSNRIHVTDGGFLQSASLDVGKGQSITPSSFNTLLVEGAGSAVRVTGVLTIGLTGPSNAATVTNGARLIAGSITVGSAHTGGGVTTTSSNNVLAVTGKDALELTIGTLSVGANSSPNNQAVLDGVVFTNMTGFSMSVGSGTASGNTLTLCGGTVISNVFSTSGGLGVGGGGGSNRLVIGNAAIYAGTNVTASVSGSGNAIEVSDEGRLFLRYLTMSGDNNTVTMGAGARLEIIRDYLHVGEAASSYSNTLTVTNGARCTGVETTGTAFSFTCGRGASSYGNLAIVTGADTVFKFSGYYIGYHNSSMENRLILDDGVQVVHTGAAATMILGEAASHSNTVTVMGGALFSNAVINVGKGGNFNKLVVSNATLHAGTQTITLGSGASSLCGSNNTLCVMAGGSVAAGAITMGAYSGSNTVTVQDASLETTGALTIQRAGTLELIGTNARVKVGGTTTTLTLNDATLRYVFDRARPMEPIIASTSTSATPLSAANVTLKLDAGKLGKAGGGKGIVLMRFATAPTTAWLPLTNAPPVMLSGVATVYVGNGGRDLLCDVAGTGGTVILVR